MKKKINHKLQELQSESELRQIELKIQDFNEKYQCIFQTLLKMRTKELMKLQQLKINIIEQISVKQIQIQNLSKRLERVLKEIKKSEIKQKQTAQYTHDFIKNETIYTQSLNKIEIQLNQICKSEKLKPKIEQNQCKIPQICRKLQSILSQRTYELSFQDQVSQVKQNQLRKYLFNESIQNTEENVFKNSHISIINNVPFVQQEQHYFDNQQNIMINN